MLVKHFLYFLISCGAIWLLGKDVKLVSSSVFLNSSDIVALVRISNIDSYLLDREPFFRGEVSKYYVDFYVIFFVCLLGLGLIWNNASTKISLCNAVGKDEFCSTILLHI